MWMCVRVSVSVNIVFLETSHDSWPTWSLVTDCACLFILRASRRRLRSTSADQEVVLEWYEYSLHQLASRLLLVGCTTLYTHYTLTRQVTDWSHSRYWECRVSTFHLHGLLSLNQFAPQEEQNWSNHAKWLPSLLGKCVRSLWLIEIEKWSTWLCSSPSFSTCLSLFFFIFNCQPFHFLHVIFKYCHQPLHVLVFLH